MKTLEVDFLLYDTSQPKELRVTLRIPVAPTYARQLMEAQANGMTVTAQTALYNLAGALGFLNGCRGMPLRVREVG